jgi:hypothetical protein
MTKNDLIMGDPSEPPATAVDLIEYFKTQSAVVDQTGT